MITGAVGLLWVALWMPLYRDPALHPRVSQEELGHIRSDGPDAAEATVPWVRLLGCRQTWAFAIGKLFADPVGFFYLYWFPKFLDTRYGVSLGGLALPLIVVYLIADVGSVAGGWLSSTLIGRGWSINRARKTAMLHGVPDRADRVRDSCAEPMDRRALVAARWRIRGGWPTCSRFRATCSPGLPLGRSSGSARLRVQWAAWCFSE
jgi:hypothetical protein